MGLFDFFRKKKATKPAKRKNSKILRIRKTFNKITTEVQHLQSQANTTNILLQKHEQQIAEHKQLIEKHTKQLETLEQLVAKSTINSINVDLPTANRSVSSISLPVSIQRQATGDNQRFDIAHFSEQERKILSVFFQNKDMALSYADIARTLGKSPNTIKNQMHQINIKADLFNYAIGYENRKRFKLKDDLRIDKYLNTGHTSTSWSTPNA